MSRGGAPNDRDDGPERKCIATGEVQPKQGLIRFVVGPETRIVPDVLGKLPGRGIWVTAESCRAGEGGCEEALRPRRETCRSRCPDDLVQEVERLLLRRVIDLISLARKAGKAVAGYEKVKRLAASEEAEVLIQALDGSGRGKSKLSTPHVGSYIGCLTADELGLAFGRETVIHGALAAGGLTQRVVEEAKRLQGVRENDGGKGHPKG